jgi:short-subunit dehydrogenase
MPMSLKLKPLADQVLVVTGASSGIGLATARKAAKAGAAVVLAARNETALRAICDEISVAGGRAHPVVADVGEAADVEKIARAAVARFGRIDSWINVAGVGVYGEVQEVSLADHERVFRTNYFGVVNGSLEALKHFRSRAGGGALINIGSILSDAAAPLMGPYVASKHAVKGFTDSLRMELKRARAPVSVTLIKPSSIGTPFADHAQNYMKERPSIPPPIYSPEVVADAILYAATHPIRHITVGAGGRQLVLTSGAAPSLADRLFAHVIPPLARRPGAKSTVSNLYQPGEDGYADGEGFRGRRVSFYTQTQKHPAVTLGVGALAVAGLAAFLGRHHLGRAARPLLAQAVRRRPKPLLRAALRHPGRAARIVAALR